MRPTLTHLAFHVCELEEMVQFYSKYCEMSVVHRRPGSGNYEVVWMAESSENPEFVFVFIGAGPEAYQPKNDYSHLGFALNSKKDVDEIAEKARKEGRLAWEPKQEPYPVGYYCALRDPQGNFVEFSYGQPLGPGAEPLTV